jgi:GGDEF domain-containing protein
MSEMQRPFAYTGISMTLPSAAWGIASYPEDGVRATELVAVADLAMYHEKRGGAGAPGTRATGPVIESEV